MKVRAEASGGGWTCHVTVEHGGEHTDHSVRIAQADLERWGRGTEQKDVEELVARSFDFLLEREPATSILRMFDLSVIPRYYPEYDRIFRDR